MNVETKDLEMNNNKGDSLVEILNNEVVTTSLQVAKVFGKRHKNVIKKIKQIINRTNEISNLNINMNDYFYLTNYFDKQNKKQPMYIMNKTGFSKLALSFTGDKANEFQWIFIKEFERMEEELNRNSLNNFLCKINRINMIDNNDYFVYLIQHDNSDFYKIGLTTNIDTRIKQLQSTNPCKLHLKKLIKLEDKNKAFELEKNLHNHFYNKNINNEWFELNKQDLNFIDNTFKKKSKKRPPK